MARPDSALRASSLAIKRVIKGRIAHLGRQFGTLCLILGNQNGHRRDCKNGTTSALRMCLTSNQKVSKWIAIHLQQIDRLQIRHFVPHPAIKRWQSRRKIYGLINIMQITPLILQLTTKPGPRKLLKSYLKVTGKCLELARNRTRDHDAVRR